MLAEKLQLQGLDIGKNAVQQIESGARFVTDIELKMFARVLGVAADELLKEPPVH
ncbi:MAG: helix-turn-helix transcriptional regulator [Acutalibacteraceae bacterium]|jgi:DNA-binding helix-turn-helix protein|nr:helix-turn-helix transcriptional regulator [Acutalibacteraceae bacterium]